nr:glycoside hydrolase [uncultured Niameybacter sp.]
MNFKARQKVSGLLITSILLSNACTVYGNVPNGEEAKPVGPYLENVMTTTKAQLALTTAASLYIEAPRSIYLGNSGFDEGDKYWENADWARDEAHYFHLDATNGINGGTCARITNNSAIEQNLTLTQPYTSYILSVYVKGSGRVEIGSGNDKKWVDLTENYEKISMTFRTDEKNKPRIYAYVADGSEAYVDNFNIEVAPVPTVDGGTISIQAENQLQIFDGWGTSLVWFGNMIGGWAPENREAISDLLFNEQDGLGLNIVRYNIGGGDAPGHDHMRPGGEMEGFATGFDGSGNLKYDWSVDTNQIQMLKDAIDRGVDITEAFSNTPPYFMTQSGCASGSNGGWSNNLKDEYYEDFAEYLTEVVKHFKEEEGITFDYLEPLNEPYTNYWKENGGQEGCHFDVDKQEEIIQLTNEYLVKKGLTDTVVAAMDESILDTGLQNFKSFSQDTKDVMEKWNVHTYGGSKRKESKNAAAMESMDLWMSEVDLGGSGSHNPDSILPALDLAKRITQDMKEIQPTAWCIWQAVENWPNMMPEGENSNWGLILANFEGEGAGGLDAEAYRTTKKFYSTKQFSKFIRPGAIMLEINDGNTLGFYDKAEDKLVYVYINDDNYNNKEVSFDLKGFNSQGAQATIYRTTGELDCEEDGTVALEDGGLTDIVPKQSITTYVVENVSYDDAIIKLNESTITDDTEANRFEYTGSWGYDGGKGAYVGDNVWASDTGSTATLYFEGTRAQIFGATDKAHGIAKITVDDRTPIEVDLYSTAREDGMCIFDTANLKIPLTNGKHLIKIEVTGTKNPLASGAAVALDYAKISKGAEIERPEVTSFKSGEKWYDTEGKRIQAHGGGMWYDAKAQKYYWYGEDKTYGYRPLRGVRCYSSTDLYNWTDEGLALTVVQSREELDTHPLYKDRSDEDKAEIFMDLDRNTAVMERPKVIYNEKTGKWVMWFHADGPTSWSNANYAKAEAGVAISDSPTGPFTYIRSYRLDQDPDWRENQGMARDMTLFVDDDGTGYIIYSSEENGTMYISKLTEDYLDVVGWHKDGLKDEEGNPVRDKAYKGVEGVDYVRIFDGWAREAPALFKYDGQYYIITSGCTGWAPNQAKYAVADTIFGPWTEIGDPCIGDYNKTTFYSQSTYVIPVDRENGKFIYMGDRWTYDSNNDNDSLADSRYIWLPIKFESDGRMSISWKDEWTLDELDKMGKIEIVTELPKVVTYGEVPELPHKLTVKQGGIEKEIGVTWENSKDLFKKVGEVLVSGTLESGETISIKLYVVPEDVLYFINSGDSTSKEYIEMKQHIGNTLINETVNDQALIGDNNWGYKGETGEERNSSGIYESLRYVTKTATNRNIEYVFKDLTPGEYTVYMGFYDPWAQWANGNRKANIFINDIQEGSNIAINEKEATYQYANITVDQDLKVTIKPVNTGSNSDVQVSWLMVSKTPELEVIINAPTITATPDTTTEKVIVTLEAAAIDGGTVLEYRLGTEEIWTTYTGAFDLTSNTIIYARATDDKGHVSEVVSKEVTNIKTPEPEVIINAPQIAVTPETGTPKKVTVTLTAATIDGGTVLEYKLGEQGSWMAYTKAFELTSNTTIYARATDGKDHVSDVVEKKVAHIKKPTIPDPTPTPDPKPDSSKGNTTQTKPIEPSKDKEPSIKLSEGILAQLGNKKVEINLQSKTSPHGMPIVSVALTVDGKAIDTLDGNAILSIPYALPKDQKAENIVVYKMEGDVRVLIPNATYVDGKVIASISTATTYVVDYNEKVFNDTKGHEAESAIAFVTARELFLGVTKDKFAPNQTMSRGMIVTVLARLYGANLEGKQAQFVDVSKDAWYGSAVAWANEKGIVQGIGENEFAPNKPITHAELQILLTNYAEFLQVELDLQSIGGQLSHAKVDATRAEVAQAIEKIVGLTFNKKAF